MATPPDPGSQRSCREATDWLILLQEEPDDPEIAARFAAWRAASPANEDAWQHTRKAMDIVARLPASNAGDWKAGVRSDGTPAAVPPGHSPRRHVMSRRRAVLAVPALAACVALLPFLPELSLRMRADARTGTAERVTLALPDGGSVTLAPASAIAFGHGSDRHHVTLLAGEALFSVTHDERHPFTVTAGSFEVRDIGTLFDVRRAGEGVAVSVKTGLVRVRGGALPDGGQELGAGQMLAADRTAFHADTRAPDQIAAWADGLLMANDQPLGEVVDRLRPWLPGKVVVSPRLADQRISGVYSLADPQAALDAIAHARQARVRRVGSWVAAVW
ncbi:two component sensor histidine kinase FecR/PupR [Gluconacetobacter sacchari DSM 12717]|uniref:DUF4880 domain-containing protein n=2 Tax=Gluconacetobacter sacchari TaxID=92759 RepID=A0A7W4NPQ0_9PROT|nr:FecR domain-containing protein [Gluconacetobacter sacchari]MBB2161834.1 DUF4880 domain-containing protein [Gluconacetobacter sacchari]GBQ21697.1 two component sensor histidine kinase FecR/PupR [Gluconacetobacter sacchari DSM 12717]